MAKDVTSKVNLNALVYLEGLKYSDVKGKRLRTDKYLKTDLEAREHEEKLK